MLEGGAAAQTGGVVSPLWAETVGGDQSTFETSPTVVGDRIYIGTNNGVRGYTVSDGELVVTGPDTGVAATPRVRDGTLYTIQNADNSPGLEELSASDSVVALDPTDGSIVGETTARDTIDTTYPVIADGAVFLGVQDVQLTSNNYYFRAIDIESDTVRWEQETNRAANPPTVADGTVYAADDGFGGSTGYAFDAAGGDINWTVSLNDDRDRAVPVVADGTVLFGGAAFDFDGNEQWRSDNPLGTPTVADGTVFAFDSDSDGTLRAINLADGSEVWSSPVDTGGSTDTSAPTVAYNSVFVSSDDGLMSVSADTGEIQWRANLGAPVTSPVVVDGVVFALTAAGRLTALPSEVAGSSRGARVQGGVRNHHHGWANVGEPDLPATLSLTPESVSLRNVPVERGGAANDPIVQVAGVTNADSISLEATYDDGSTEQTETFSFQAVDASAEAVDQASALTQVTLEADELDAGTWVDLEIVDDDGNTVVDSLAIDHPEDGWLLEGDDLGYHVFETVEDVRLVLGTFADQTIETADLRALAEARVRDVNYFLGSPRGLLGDVGLNIEVAGVDRGGYTVSEKEEYAFVDPSVFMSDLADAYENDTGSAPASGASLWIGMHPEPSNISLDGAYESDGDTNLYAAAGSQTAAESLSEVYTQYMYFLYVLCHEVGHAYGLAHTGRGIEAPLVRQSCVLSGSFAIGQDGDASRIETAIESPDVPGGGFSVVPQISETLGLGVKTEDPAIGDRSNLVDISRTRSEGLPTTARVQARTAAETDTDTMAVPVVEKGDTQFVIELRRFVDGVVVEGGEGGDRDLLEWGTDDPTGVLVYRAGEDVLPVQVENRQVVSTSWYQSLQDLSPGAEDDRRPKIEIVDNWAGAEDMLRSPVGDESASTLTDAANVEDEQFLQFEVETVNTGQAGVTDSEITVTEGLPFEPGSREMRVVRLDVLTVPPVTRSSEDGGIPAGGCGSCLGQDVVHASLDLTVRDSEGRTVGHTDDGTYAVEIPEAIASGARETGVEWIAVPDDVDVEITVDASDIERYVREFVALGDESEDGNGETAEDIIDDAEVPYTVSETRYPSEAGGEEDPGGATTVTRVQTQAVEVGNQRDATIANPGGDVDLVDIQQATAEAPGAITFRNRGDDQINLDGWQLRIDQTESYTFARESLEPGAELTLTVSQEAGTGQDPVWETDTQLPSPDGGLVELQTGDGELVLEVVYDARGRIRFDQESADDGGDGDSSGVDEDLTTDTGGDDDIGTLTILGLLGAAGVAGYALKQRLSSESK